MKNNIKHFIVVVLLCVAMPVFAQEGGGQNRAIAEMAQYVVVVVIVIWVIRKIFKK